MSDWLERMKQETTARENRARALIYEMAAREGVSPLEFHLIDGNPRDYHEIESPDDV